MIARESLVLTQPKRKPDLALSSRSFYNTSTMFSVWKCIKMG